MYQRAADKGIEVGVGDAPDATAQDKALPGGLVGDTANRAYTSETSKPQ